MQAAALTTFLCLVTVTVPMTALYTGDFLEHRKLHPADKHGPAANPVDDAPGSPSRRLHVVTEAEAAELAAKRQTTRMGGVALRCQRAWRIFRGRELPPARTHRPAARR